MASDGFRMVCPCLLGMEGLVAEELRKMQAQDVAAQDGRVFFSGDYGMLARANLWSRYSERVQILVGMFSAESFSELFEKVTALPWERWINAKDAFPVKGHALSSKLMSVPDCQAIIKKAIVERLKKKYKIAWFEESGAVCRVQFLIFKNTVSVMIDTTGAGLYKRGYRAVSNDAPIKETLAAAMVYLSRLRKDANMIDPFCGSGTLLIESALYAMNIAPGMKRSFAAEKWKNIPAKIWQQERSRAVDLIDRDANFHAYGYDIDKNAVELSLANAKKAGVASRITAVQRDIRDYKETGEHGCVICNPPYGERLLDIKEAESLYEVMGQVFERKRGWNYTVISHDRDFEYYFGRKADKRRKLYNGNLQCQVYMYFKY